CSRDALLIPGLPRVGLCFEILRHIASDVRVCAGVAGFNAVCGDRVVHVISFLPPRREYDLLISVVWVDRGDEAFERVVEQDRADADLNAEFKLVPLICKLAEEWLILADGLTFVVEDGPAAADPTRVDDRPALDQRPGLGLNLLLNLPTEAVRV